MALPQKGCVAFAGDAEDMRVADGRRRLTPSVGASILATWFFLPPPVPFVVVDRRRRVGREL